MTDKNKNHLTNDLEFTPLPCYAVSRPVLPQQDADKLSGYDDNNDQNCKSAIFSFIELYFLSKLKHVSIYSSLRRFLINKSSTQRIQFYDRN